MASFRTHRVSEEIRKVVSELLVKKIQSKLPAFVTISHVEITKDLTIAKVRYSLFGSPEDCAQTESLLAEEKKALRYEVGKKVRLRLTPELVLIRDNSTEQAARINELLAKSKPSEEE